MFLSAVGTADNVVMMRWPLEIFEEIPAGKFPSQKNGGLQGNVSRLVLCSCLLEAVRWQWDARRLLLDASSTVPAVEWL